LVWPVPVAASASLRADNDGVGADRGAHDIPLREKQDGPE
jgi:hypothetical protein